jgi:membrane associated rhomboid family serine protease
VNEQELVELMKDDDALRREVVLAAMLRTRVRVVWGLMGAMIVAWVAAKGWGIHLYDEAPWLAKTGLNAEQASFMTGMKVNTLIRDSGQWWRLASSIFVHMDLMHLAFNAYGLYALGPMVERFYGWQRTLALFMGSGVLASLASVLFVDSLSGGASGAIYGLVGALMMFGWKYRDALPERVSRVLTTGMLPWTVFGIGIGFFSFLPMDNAAHIGGLLSGALLALLMRAQLEPTRSRASAWIGGALVAASAAVLAWMVVGWSQEIARCAGDAEAFAQCYITVSMVNQ